MRKIFIDCGSNVGKVLERAIRRRSEFEFFAFEPNADLIPTISTRIEKHPDTKVEVYNKAVWTHNNGLSFFVGHPETSSVMPDKRVPLIYGRQLDYANPRHVESMDFSQWILNNFDLSDHIVVKMDIEGAEYPVLEKMIEDGSIYYINKLYVEWHWYKIGGVSQARHKELMARLEWITRLKRHYAWNALNYFAA
ncbi:MAG: FkbM family methyltransferase [Leptolyngbya sp. UWPOB_LEPTO1]|uniref:FkbM family methyltransferase n=1 Tax=Leptolyngbya sp. UWPOB_LEPTO1 TaxID=2815653 RepID=UPI001ACBCE22|nr:FkbM family methyltransferase [Leptolyngbya sp. UWPOB_LEPTO1]MBN8560158.1 FkbM family methyltransferase [Leptolyngbya sp. UWPOB_LEPTO1]